METDPNRREQKKDNVIDFSRLGRRADRRRRTRRRLVLAAAALAAVGIAILVGFQLYQATRGGGFWENFQPAPAAWLAGADFEGRLIG